MWLSIQGMYEYDNTLFDGLDVPTYTDPDNNIHVVDKSVVINNICLQCAELEIIYPSFDTMKLAIGVWSASNQDTWRRLYESQLIEYNPIWNVDAEVHQTDRLAGSDIRTIGRNETITPNLTNTRSVKGFNSDTWSDAEKNAQTGNTQDYENVTDNATDDHTRTYTETRTGNIGVTSSEKLIKEYREVAEFSIIDYITESFKNRFCLLVY